MLGEVTADCPGAYGEDEACTDSSKVKPVFHMVPVYFSLCSCIASMIGSIIMIIPYVLWKDVRSGLRTIVTYLAIADFFTAFGYTVASFNYINYTKHKGSDYVTACSDFSIVCQIQAYISSWASLSSFWWTAILAYYLYSTITKGKSNVLNKWFPMFHVLVWGSPILVMFPLLLTGSLGYSLFSAGGWCFIASEKETGHLHYENYNLSAATILKILVGGKAVEIATYVWVFVLYGKIFCDLRKKKRRLAETDEKPEGFITLLETMEKKLYTIPFAFIFIRIWGTLQFIFSIAVFANSSSVDSTGCVSKPVYNVFLILACLQSLGDGAQGWCNALLYIVFSPKIRQRLIGLVFSPICTCLYDTIGLLQHSTVRPGGTSIQYRSVATNDTKNDETGRDIESKRDSSQII